MRRVALEGEREVTAPGIGLARLDGALRISDADRAGNGSGWVSGADGEREPIEPGKAVLWEQGEEHESGSDTGMTALVLEGESLDV